MHDMTRDAMQDLLPDLLHGRLSADDAAALERAVAADAELTAELAMLRAVHAAHAPAPTLDLTRIVAALPSPPVVAAPVAVDDLAVRRAAKRPLISHRFARAAALLVVVGGGTMVSVWNSRRTASDLVTGPVAAESVAVNATGVQLGLGASTEDLSMEQLRALEADINALDGIPAEEPEMGTELLAGEGA